MRIIVYPHIHYMRIKPTLLKGRNKDCINWKSEEQAPRSCCHMKEGTRRDLRRWRLVLGEEGTIGGEEGGRLCMLWGGRGVCCMQGSRNMQSVQYWLTDNPHSHGHFVPGKCAKMWNTYKKDMKSIFSCKIENFILQDRKSWIFLRYGILFLTIYLPGCHWVSLSSTQYHWVSMNVTEC